ncbi:MAG TPA: hypothetical protein VMN82_15695 [Thermoanaerobaculia bacterium]|nr:hypothetical protein [Thermoanaerobaculia bacterium]
MRSPFSVVAGVLIACVVGALASACGRAADRAAAPSDRACLLLTAEEVGAIFGRQLESSGSGSVCEYGTRADHASPTEQLVVKLEVSHEARSEADVQSIYARVGKDVNRSLHPERHAVANAMAVGDEVAGVGDWAFSVDVASVNTGTGFSTRGRILEAQKDATDLTVGATMAPDPGVRRLDAMLAAVAKTAFSRLTGDRGTKKSEK